MMPYSRTIWGVGLRALTAVAALLIAVGAARGQQDEAVSLTVDAEHIGLCGVIRPGAWTPMLVTLENHLSEPVKVRLEWVLNDADGDEVHPRRVVTLSPQRVQQAWLYAVPPINYTGGSDWYVKVIDDKTGVLLATRRVVVAKSQLLSPYDRAIAVTSNMQLGLQPYEQPWTQQEATRFLRGFDPGELPDRWYGLSMVQALIWTPDAPNAGADPGAPAISSESRQALLEWLRRGGHLVIVLPTAGDLWSASPLKELVAGAKMETITDVSPTMRVLGSPLRNRANIDVKAIAPAADMAVLLCDEGERPLVVARPYGLGRVTIIGVDLTDKRLTRMDLPNSFTAGYPLLRHEGLWATVFGWRGPVFSPAMIQAEQNTRSLVEPSSRDYKDLDRAFIANHIDMRDSAAAPLLLAILLFAFYWLAAGPVSFGVLKSRDLARHSWAVFALIVLVCSAVAWGGALILRRKSVSIEHFTFLDADASSGLVHAQSWMSIYAPTHGPVEITIDPERPEDNRNTLSAAGLSPEQPDGGFIAPQRYTVDAAAPNRAAAPFRGTAKQLEVDYLGRWTATDSPLPVPWVLPHGRIAVENGWPKGELTHGLPGVLTDVVVIYNPGDGEEPWVWPWLREWPAGAVGKLDGPPAMRVRLAVPPVDRTAEWGGYLGQLIHLHPGHAQPVANARDILSQDQGIKDMEMLTFFDTLPSPRFVPNKQDFLDNPVGFHRSIARRADLSPLLAFRRLIVIGHLADQPLPVPLHIDGEAVASKGWTTVRWIARISEEGVGSRE